MNKARFRTATVTDRFIQFKDAVRRQFLKFDIDIIGFLRADIGKKQNELAVYTSKNQCDLVLNITIALGDDAPKFFILSAQNISKIAGLKCDIGFDFYDYRNR